MNDLTIGSLRRNIAQIEGLDVAVNPDDAKHNLVVQLIDNGFKLRESINIPQGTAYISIPGEFAFLDLVTGTVTLGVMPDWWYR